MKWTIDQNDILYDNWEYYNTNKEIAEITLNRHWKSIQEQAYRLGVERIKKRFKSNKAILNEVRNYIDGLMLGDGCITHIGISGTGLYQQDCKHKIWLDAIKKDLYTYGIESSVNNGRLRTDGLCKIGGSITYGLSTHRYIEFKKMHDRFYQKWYDIDKYPKTRWHEDEDSIGDYYVWKKIVPEDICLTSECVANWYKGDGCMHKHKNPYISLSTDDFLRDDTIFLAGLLSEILDIKCGITGAGKIQISTYSDVNTFINYIKCHKISCYDYKFQNRY